ncbi:MAG: hypothetical protein WD757_03865 [Actinomycetota bacterium]
MRRTLLLFFIVPAVAWLPARSAYACSCAPVGAQRLIQDSDAAFVGTLIGRDAPLTTGIIGPGDQATLTFRVEGVAKGELSEMVEVETSSSTSSCGISANEGDRLGLALYGEEDGWQSSLCSQIDPEALSKAADLRHPLAGSPPKEEPASAKTWAVPIVALAGIALVGVWLWRRRRGSAH